MKDWIKEFPNQEGYFWFYGYRYGKGSKLFSNDPELQLVKVIRISNGFLHVTDGNIMYESEVEDAYFKDAILPEIPEEYQT